MKGGRRKKEQSRKPVILIADSSPHILNLLAGTFELANFEVRTAAGGEECIDAFREIKERLDVILMDGAIAGDAGVGVILNVRREKPEQKILVVVEEENVKAQTMRVGADVVVMKPITGEAIVLKVSEMMTSKGPSFMERKRVKFDKTR